MQTDTTTAEQISARYKDDGQEFSRDGGGEIAAECEDASEEKDQDWQREATLYRFADGSAIIFTSCYWDVWEEHCAQRNSDDEPYCWE